MACDTNIMTEGAMVAVVFLCWKGKKRYTKKMDQNKK
jgi:hypothetical protein